MGTVTPFRPATAGRFLTPTSAEVPMADRLPELVDFLTTLLRVPRLDPAVCGSETLLASALGTEPQLLREFRSVGLVAPQRVGRSYLYAPEDIQRAAVLVALTRLGAVRDELVDLFSSTAARCAACAHAAPSLRCRPADCAESLLSRIELRCETELDRLAELDRLLAAWHSGT